MACDRSDGHDCAARLAANDALRRHLDRACEERDRLRAERDRATDPSGVQFECRICGRPVMGAAGGSRLCDPCEDALLGTPAGEALLLLRREVAKAVGGLSGTADRWRLTPGYGFAADAVDEFVRALHAALYPLDGPDPCDVRGCALHQPSAAGREE